MANLTPEQERINRIHLEHRVRRGEHSYEPDCYECRRIRNMPARDYGTSRAVAYNAVHGTRVADNAALDQILANEAEMRRLMQEDTPND